jgi:protein-arginine kinase activator protein McsA
MRRLSYQKYHDLAASRGFKWLGPAVSTIYAKTMWKCDKGHIWATKYKNIYIGNGCPICANRVSITEDQYRQATEKAGLEWLGPYPKTTIKRTKWRCPCGHEWYTTYQCINSNKTRCQKCYNKRRGNSLRKTKSDYIKMAKSKGFEFIGKVPRNNKGKTTWKCSNNHAWESTYHDIQQGKGCPYCYFPLYINGAQASKVQVNLATLLGVPEEYINYKLNNRYIDIAYPEHKIAIEYDGWYWHKDDNNEKDEDIFSSGWKLLRIKSRTSLPDKSSVLGCLDKLKNGNTYQEIVLGDWLSG